MMKIKKILVPVDFSEGCDEALQYASGLCQKFDAQLSLIHVIGLAPYINYGETITVTILNEFEKTARDKMKQLVRQFEDKFPVAARVETKGVSVPDAICEEAKKTDSDLIIIAKHSRKGLNRLLLGSVTEKVVRMAPCPVLMIPIKTAS